MELVLPSVKYKDSFLEAVKEFQADADYTHRNRWYRKLNVQELENNFAPFIEDGTFRMINDIPPEERVQQSDYWLTDDGEFIGRVSIRHKLTEKLLGVGGNIGYDIRPSKRGQGYGNKILELSLQKAKGLGLKRVLLTSDIRNTASRKIIEKNGGILENQIPNPAMSYDALRYWIDIK